MAMKTLQPPKVVDGERIVDTLNRIPWLRRFLVSKDDFDQHVQPMFVVTALNAYVGEPKYHGNHILDQEVVDEVLRIAWTRGDI